jgi:hypothetical protein
MVKMTTAITTSEAPAASSRRAAVRPEISGRAGRAAAAGTAPGRPGGDVGPALSAWPLAGGRLAGLISSSSTTDRRLMSQVLVAAIRLSSWSIRRSSATCGPASQIPQRRQYGSAGPAEVPHPGQ